ncbi:MAG: cytidylate kinase family protein [Candidatus Woesearchaeota archaeon]
MIITIAGPAGSGKGSVARILSEKYGLEKYSTGDFRRMAAKHRGMTIEQFNKLGETDSSTDLEADEFQKKLGIEKDNFVIDARLGWYFIPNSIKILLDVDNDSAAKRIFNDKSDNRVNQTKMLSLDEQKLITIKRNESDKLRYKKIYGIEDPNDPRNFDLVIDTSHKNIEEVASLVIQYIEFIKEKK